MAKLMTREISEEIVRDVDSFLFDCDGVLWDGNGPIKGSLETVLRLKELGKQVFYVTNNSSQTRDDYVKKCATYGFPAQKDEILCTAYIAAEYLRTANFKDKVYVIGKKEAMGAELENAGIRYTGTGPDPLEGNTYADWLSNIKLDPEVKCVLVGFDPHISYMKLIRAASYLKKPDCVYLATNEDSSLPVKNSDICIPGTGCIVKPVSLASGREPIVMGKPAPNMFEVLRKVHNLEPSRCMMIGDRKDTDIMFAKNCGMRSMLVFSGISSIDDIQQISDTEELEESQPDYYAENLAGLGIFI
ncbi:phosphoglycolate phosphatase [Plakobranchus ocellatus]|uniref:Phosphoglycolate phosphatase n=1 Tax=Plakobranchus ocellatus TaxID=259542 RepID=A0AAV4C8I1_9GAST|nr:phosphoglycolate phosphatase [Plakobranchus ocellatus]